MKVYKYINEIPIYRFIFEPIKSNMYVMIYQNYGLVIDPFIDNSVKELFEEYNINDVIIILTHEHYDHVSGVEWLCEIFPCEVIASKVAKDIMESDSNRVTKYYMALFVGKPEEEKLARESFVKNYTCHIDKTFENKMELEWCSFKLELTETPGHSEGSICIRFEDKYLFTGDTLVGGANIITRLPGGSKKQYLEIARPYLLSVDKDTYVFPGHGEAGYISEFHIV